MRYQYLIITAANFPESCQENLLQVVHFKVIIITKQHCLCDGKANETLSLHYMMWTVMAVVQSVHLYVSAIICNQQSWNSFGKSGPSLL